MIGVLCESSRRAFSDVEFHIPQFFTEFFEMMTSLSFSLKRVSVLVRWKNQVWIFGMRISLALYDEWPTKWCLRVNLGLFDQWFNCNRASFPLFVISSSKNCPKQSFMGENVFIQMDKQIRDNVKWDRRWFLPIRIQKASFIGQACFRITILHEQWFTNYNEVARWHWK